MADKSLPCPTLLRQLMSYDPDTGQLTWLPRPDGLPRWNTRYAGKEAFTARTVYGYRVGRILGRNYFSHRVIWAIIYGEWPETIDHINGNRSDNRIENLRSVTQQENCRNSAVSKNNSSGVVGVGWYAPTGKWRANITIDRRMVSLGYFTDFDDAIDARKAAEIAYGFHKNHGRAA